MKKIFSVIAVIYLLLSITTLSGCETFARAFADQAGRNVANFLFSR